MEELVELAKLFQKTKFKASGLMGLVLEPGSQMERLYEGIGAGAITTDADIFTTFPELNGSAARAATLKSKLKDRLSDAVLLLDWKEPAYADRQKAFSECSRKWASATIMMSKNARKNAVDLMESVLRNTRRFEFTEMTIDILQSLSMYYALIEGEIQKHELAEAELAEAEAVWEQERKAEKWYMELVNKFVRQKASKELLARKAGEYAALVKPYLDSCPSYRVQLFGRLIGIVYYDSIGDYATTVQLAEAGLEVFRQKDYKSITALQAFHYHLFVAYLNLRQYDTCEQLVNQHQELFEPGSYNWFKLYEVIFLTAMHTGHYAQARDLCEKIISHPSFKSQPAPIFELWKIFEAYIAFLIAAGRLSSETGALKFRLAKFLNEIEMFAQDKSGMNVPVLVVQFLHYLAQGDFDACIGRVDALAKYRLRYLKDDHSFRNQAFIRMLEQIPKAVFDSIESEHRCAHIYTLLRDRPLESANQNHEIEIIPYEALWEIILQGLPTRDKFLFADQMKS